MTQANGFSLPFNMGKDEETAFLPLTEEKPSTLLGDYLQYRKKRRSVGEATLLVCGVALLCWCGYLTLTINRGLFFLNLQICHFIFTSKLLGIFNASFNCDENMTSFCFLSKKFSPEIFLHFLLFWNKNISHLLPGFSNTSTESTRTELDLIERIINEVVASLKPEEDEQVWHYEN